MSEMTADEVLEQLIITKEQVDEATGKTIPQDFKIKSSLGYYDQLKKYYEEEKGSGYALPWQKTDGDFSVRLGELTIFQGVSGHGKSMMLSQIFLYLMNYTKVLIASMEMKPVLSLERMITQRLQSNQPTLGYVKEFCEKYNDKLFIYDQQGVTSEEDMFATLAYGRHILGVDVFCIDSLMKIGNIDQEDYNSQKRFVDKLATYCRDLHIHVFLVCHTKKMGSEYEKPDATHIMGSSTLRNLADNVLLCWRNRELGEMIEEGKCPEDRKYEPTALLSVQKQRNHTYEGTFGLYFDQKSLTYKEKPCQ